MERTKRLQTDKIFKITINGYDEKRDTYKFVLHMKEISKHGSKTLPKEWSKKLNIKWERIKKAFNAIKKTVSKSVFGLFMYELERDVVINDKKYNSLKKFINGINPLTLKEVRHLNDVQMLMDAVLSYKNDEDKFNQIAVSAFLSRAFKIIN